LQHNTPNGRLTLKKRENELQTKKVGIDIVYQEMQVERIQFESDIEVLDKLKKEMTCAESDVNQMKIENVSMKHHLLERAQQLEAAHSSLESERENVNKRMEIIQKTLHDKEILYSQEKKQFMEGKALLAADRQKHDIAWKRLTVLEESLRNREKTAKNKQESIEKKAVELENLAKSLQAKVVSLEFERDEFDKKVSHIVQVSEGLPANGAGEAFESRINLLEIMSVELSKKEASLTIRCEKSKEMENQIKKTVIALQKKDEDLECVKKKYEERMQNVQLLQDEIGEAGIDSVYNARPKQ